MAGALVLAVRLPAWPAASPAWPTGVSIIGEPITHLGQVGRTRPLGVVRGQAAYVERRSPLTQNVFTLLVGLLA
jgi:hypothetical protein